MIDRTTKLRWRRGLRHRQQRLEEIGSQTEERLDRHFFRRLGRLYEVRRFMLTWLLFIALLIGVNLIQTGALGGYYQTIKPLPGGIYSEGIVGSFTNANPIFATSEVDSAVSRLLFSSLMSYDADNHLVNDLAKNLAVDGTGKVYTLALKDDVRWHDGRNLTSADVVFTYKTIQNPDTKSPLFSGWQGVNVTAPDAHTVVFTLAGTLASFPHSLTNGILPEHILGSVDPGSLRSSLFNTTEPIGSGPFKWNNVEVRGNNVEDREQRISLIPNEFYYKGAPKLSELVVRTFLDEDLMMESFSNGELTAMAGVQDISEEQKNTLDISEYNVPITGAVMAFLRTTHDFLKDVDVRQALVSATDQPEIISKLAYPSIATHGPLLKNMIAFDSNIQQATFSLERANDLLNKAGWGARDPDGIRVKDGKRLTLLLNTLNNAEYANVANILQKQWGIAGVDLVVAALNQRDLQTAINNRSYSVLLYGIALDSDPDQFAYWHSSQADVRAQPRFNFSDYNSKTVDNSLEAGRTRNDVSLRVAKYRPFLEAWRNDAPAISLYQPRFLYITRGAVFNFNVRSVNTPADRYADVQNWMVRTERATIK